MDSNQVLRWIIIAILIIVLLCLVEVIVYKIDKLIPGGIFWLFG